MRFFVAITDDNWFAYLAAKQPDEINFWRPSGTQSFHSLSPGEPMLFKLHSPRNFIVGGAFFSHYNTLPQMIDPVQQLVATAIQQFLNHP
ncbi:MAG TPA: hypothetical protein VNW97_11665 [Candidatus Saccharimonadales bacterium]|jgi:putative restriction endonuclease|nr:hypothetical protein [Candidatus Saccharimonadales bacterium]